MPEWFIDYMVKIKKKIDDHHSHTRTHARARILIHTHRQGSIIIHK